jgi:hypothetical protein
VLCIPVADKTTSVLAVGNLLENVYIIFEGQLSSPELSFYRTLRTFIQKTQRSEYDNNDLSVKRI